MSNQDFRCLPFFLLPSNVLWRMDFWQGVASRYITVPGRFSSFYQRMECGSCLPVYLLISCLTKLLTLYLVYGMRNNLLKHLRSNAWTFHSVICKSSPIHPYRGLEFTRDLYTRTLVGNLIEFFYFSCCSASSWQQSLIWVLSHFWDCRSWSKWIRSSWTCPSLSPFCMMLMFWLLLTRILHFSGFLFILYALVTLSTPVATAIVLLPSSTKDVCQKNWRPSSNGNKGADVLNFCRKMLKSAGERKQP